jgi:gamma-glutamylcyclotransferase (GGCT)/AIG2-like uncharacterized protein YtfP
MGHYIAAYGTLRKDHYNFKRFESLEYIKTVRIPGYELWDFGPYPYIIEKENAEITVDILKTNASTKRSIDSMEIGAGYKLKEITIDDMQCTIYYMDKIYNNTTQIQSGDYNEKNNA